jgi:hypothetical protein
LGNFYQINKLIFLLSEWKFALNTLFDFSEYHDIFWLKTMLPFLFYNTDEIYIFNHLILIFIDIDIDN